MTDHNELLVALQHDHNAFCLAAYALSPHLREQAGVCGDWSPQQVVAHLAAWNNETVACFAALHAGQQETKNDDADAFNKQAVAARAGATWDEQLAELDASLATLVHAARDTFRGDVARDQRCEQWLQRRADDYREHTVQLDVWTSTGLANT